MAKMSTNDLIDTISGVIEEFNFSNFGMDDVESRIREDRSSQEWIVALARQIARAVR
jgi:hypothetical protein